MDLKILPYSPENHAALISTWLDDEGVLGTGIEDWDSDVCYWQEESPDTFHAAVFCCPEPAAAVYYFTEPDHLHIGAILVDPSKRAQGIGTRVLKYLMYVHTQCPKATAVIFPDNNASHRTFRRAGFVYDGCHPDMTAEYWVWHRPAVTIAETGGLEPWMYRKENPYKFVVIFARYQGKWLYTRHNDRRTWETAGGHIEPAEQAVDAAGRELWEETGALDFNLRYVFDYHVDNTAARPGDHAAGQVFLADVETLGDMPAFEMAETSVWDTYPPLEQLTYPAILPELFRALQNYL